MPLKKSNDYAFFSHQGFSYFVNHSTGARYRLCSDQNVNNYNPLETYQQCSAREKLQYNLIVAGLYASGQFYLCEKYAK